MTRRAALVLLFLSIVALSVAYATAFSSHGAPESAARLFAVATATSLVAILFLGAARKGRVSDRRLFIAFASILVAVGGGLLAAFRSAAVDPNSSLILGLPAGAAIIIFVVGFVPVVVLPIVYAVTFDDEERK